MSQTATHDRFAQLKVGDELPQRQFQCGNVQQMLYNAALWNGHRIHFDEPYAKDVEGYPGLVVAGPLLGDWLHQCVEEWLGNDGRIFSIDYSNRVATYVGDTLISGGVIAATRADSKEVEIDVFIKNTQGDNVAPGKILARFDNV
ncbi:MAG: hydroxyacyl-ACP dehydratase HTD2-like protein with hotdog domain [Bacteroidia bacterium]|jgi:hydroxyacyl-ACP dehydratase HTD2-like protein with hotdog domain